MKVVVDIALMLGGTRLKLKGERLLLRGCFGGRPWAVVRRGRRASKRVVIVRWRRSWRCILGGRYVVVWCSAVVRALIVCMRYIDQTMDG